MGVVYLAEDTTLGRRVALKVLDRTLTSAPDFEERFRQEARLVAGLDHPHIVQVHAFERIGPDLAIDMAYIEGGSLADAEETGRIRTDQVLRSAVDVLGALASCHAAGVIHRDVKPSNILLAGDGRALLSDFGLARLVAAHHADAMQSTASSGFFLGTPRYAPPESWDGREPSPAWDVYSVGTVLYEAVASRTPYDADNPFVLIKQMTEQAVPRLADVTEHVSKELSDLVAAMLAHDPEDRPADAGDALRQLANVPEMGEHAGGKPSTIVQILPARVRRAHRPFRRSAKARVAVAGGVTLAVALAAAAGIYWLAASAGRPVAGGEPAATAPPQPMAAASYVVFDTTDPRAQTSWPGHWLMARAEEPDAWTVLAGADTHLWFLRAVPDGGDRLAFEGHWAEYMDESARVFRHGTLEGSGDWRKAWGTMAVTLKFRSAADGFRWHRSFLLHAAEEPFTETAFVQRFERAGHVQRLVYGELLPRGLSWAASVESGFLAPRAGRMVVPFLSRTPAMRVDGRLDEAAWRPVVSRDEGVLGTLASRLGSGGGQLLLRYDDEALYVGIRADTAAADATMSLALLTGFGVPVGHSARWGVRMEAGAIVSHWRTVGGRELPWDGAWQGACLDIQGRYEAEVCVPFDSVGGGPGPTDRWRVNCAVATGGAGDAQPVARWGSEATKAAEHGAIVVFGPRGTGPP